MGGFYNVDIFNQSSFINYKNDSLTTLFSLRTPSYSVDDVIFYLYYYGSLLILTMINFVGNGLIITCVIKNERLQVPGNYYIVSTACSDLFLGVVYPIYNVSHMDTPAIQETIGKIILISKWH